MSPIKRKRQDEDEDGWMHISDMMSVLMMIFLFISVAYMFEVRRERDNMHNIAAAYHELQVQLYIDLQEEFKDDLNQWNAIIDKKDLSIRFQEPDVLFDAGSFKIKEDFITILNDFFPRYINLLSSPKYINNIEEIRIEGHTSTEWSTNVDEDTAYQLNMKLSQDRTREVLAYCLSLLKGSQKGWTKYRLTANGLSSSKIIYKENDSQEDKILSRRVEFKARTNTADVIDQILNQNE